MLNRATKITDEQDGGDAERLSATGPVRLRRAKRPKIVARGRSGSKSRRKAPAPGGIHQRSNKKVGW